MAGTSPYRLGGRAEFLAAMLAELFAPTGAQAHPFGLRTIAPDDPTVALLDAWATVADVIAFYQARIASEGFKRTAVLPESVMALANLVGKRPRPGLAASVYLAYTLSPDPADTAVRLSAGLQAQTVPGPGELPQTFETTQDLIARPSWNSLRVRTTGPLSVTKDTLPLLGELTVDGVSPHLSANDVILLEFTDGQDPGVLRVAQATPDTASGRTVVELRIDQERAVRAVGAAVAPILQGHPIPSGPFQGAVAADLSALQSDAAAAAQASGAAAGPDADKLRASLATASQRLQDWAALAGARGDAATARAVGNLRADLMVLAAEAAVLAGTDPQRGTPQEPAPPVTDNLVSATVQLSEALAVQPQTMPGAPSPPRGQVNGALQPGSDQLLRMLIGLRPELATGLYPALATMTVGAPMVRSASALRVKAAPFGAQVAPRAVGGTPGKPPQTEEWAIDQTHQITLTVPADERQGFVIRNLLDAVQGQLLALDVNAPAGQSQQAFRLDRHTHAADTALPGDLGSLTVAADQRAESLVLTYTQEPPASFRLTVRASSLGGIEFLIEDDSCVWDPANPAPLRATLKGHRLTVAWSPPPAGAPNGAITMLIETPLPLGDAAAKVLTLDRVYDTILNGTWVVVEQTAVPAAARAGAVGQAPPAQGPEDKAGGQPGGQAGPAQQPPASQVIARVLDARPVTVHQYGITSRVTRLQLDRAWADPNVRLLSGVRNVVVRAQPDILRLRWPKMDADVAGDRLELDRLYAGLESGRQVIVSGTRAGLPGGSTLTAAEVATVSAVLQGTDSSVPGDMPHTTLLLAAPLTYRYQRESATVLGNVVPALHGETVQEVLGSGQAGQLHQVFTLSRAPLLAVASATQEGSASPLTVTVEGQPWHEVDRIDKSTAARSYLTGSDASGHVTVMFSGPLPVGSGNVSASYRVGQGSLGNARAHQITQLVTRPLGVSGVDNPLPAAGGTDGDSPGTLRASTSKGLTSLGRLISVTDYQDAAASWAGVGKAAAVTVADGGQVVVHVTVASTVPVALETGGGLCTALRTSLTAAGDPAIPLVLAPADLVLIVLGLVIQHDPTVNWPTVSAAVRAALLDAFGYQRRDLGQDVVLSEIIAAAHAIGGVLSVTVETLRVIPGWSTATDLAQPPPSGPVPAVIVVPGARIAQRTATTLPGETVSAFAARVGVDVSALLLANPDVNTVVFDAPQDLMVSSGLQPAQLAYLPVNVPDALTLREG